MNFILNIDDRILRSANGLIGHWGWFDGLIKILSEYVVYLVPIILLALWFYSKYSKKVALQTFISGMLALLFAWIISHYIWYRPRPYVADLGLKELIFHRPDYSFPSDHIALFSALAVSTWLLNYRKLSWWLIAMTIVVGIARVIIGVHYPLDIIGGMAVGILAALIMQWLKGSLTKYLYNPIIFVTHKIHLS